MNLTLAFRLASREIRAGLAGFRIFLVCLILGVAAIAAITSTSRTIHEGLAREGRNILGADIALRLRHRTATADELATVSKLTQPAKIASVITMQAMVGTDDNRVLSRLKAVDDNYPLYGEVKLEPPMPLQQALAYNSESGHYGVVLEPLLLEQLGSDIGEKIFIGTLEAEIRALVHHEPDRLSDGFALGPRTFLGADAIEATRLMQPGSVFSHNYKFQLPGPVCDPVGLPNLVERIRDTLPTSGWRIRTCTNSAPELERFIRILSQFLVLVGLMALIVGGIGVANAVRGYLDSRRLALATLKCLGAPGRLIFRTYMLQILALALLGVVIGLGLGVVAPLPLYGPLAAVLEIPLALQIEIEPLAIAAAYGILIAFAFAVWPLASAREIRAVALFREEVAPIRKVPRPRYILLTVVLFLLLIGLLFAVTRDQEFTLWFLAIVSGSLLLLLLLARWLMSLARRFRVLGGEEWRIALGNIARPGSRAPEVILALGMALTLLIAVAMTDAALSYRLQKHLIDEAVTFFFLNVRSDEADGFADFIVNADGVLDAARAPILRGTIVRVGEIPVAELNPSPDVAWVLRGDRGLSYERTLPGDSTVVSGEWWPEEYEGPPLLSIADDIAHGLGIGVGDTMTVNILGRELTAEIANTRSFEWRDIGIHFALIFTPDALQSAPHSFLFTVSMERDVRREAELQNQVAREYPGITAIWVREVAEQVNQLARNIGLAIRACSVLAVVSGLLVLGGVVTTDHHRRRVESVIWKVLGATRKKVVSIYALEYVVLAMSAGIIGGLCGSVASWVITSQVIGLEWIFTWEVLLAVPVAVALALSMALFGAWRLLGQRAGAALREE